MRVQNACFKEQQKWSLYKTVHIVHEVLPKENAIKQMDIKLQCF